MQFNQDEERNYLTEPGFFNVTVTSLKIDEVDEKGREYMYVFFSDTIGRTTRQRIYYTQKWLIFALWRGCGMPKGGTFTTEQMQKELIDRRCCIELIKNGKYTNLKSIGPVDEAVRDPQAPYSEYENDDQSSDDDLF